MASLHQAADAPTLQTCRTCDGRTLRLREGRCLICYREFLAETIDRDAKDEDAAC